MKLTTTKKITTVEEIPLTVDIVTPLFSKKNDYGTWVYYAIDESENGPAVTEVYSGVVYKNISIMSEGCGQFPARLSIALECERISEEEFLTALENLVPKYDLKTAI